MNDYVEQTDDNTEQQAAASAENRARYAINKRTRHGYVKRRPGQRLVTSEEIRKELEDFP